MKLQQLTYFLAVAEAGSISQAAATLHMAQPSLSHQITSLERDLGGALFERHPRGLRLTPAGRAFHVEAVSVVEHVERARQAFEEVSTGVVGQLAVATVTSLAVGIIPAVAQEWRREHPDMTLRLHEYTHADRLEDGVLSGAGDLGFGPLPRAKMGEIIEVGAEEFVFILPADHPCLATEHVDPADLSADNWVLYESDHGLSQVVTKVTGAFGYSPNASVRTSQVEAAARLAAAGLGPALVPGNAVPRDLAPVTRSATRPLVRRLAAYSRTSLSNMARDFAEELCNPRHGLIQKVTSGRPTFEL